MASKQTKTDWKWTAAREEAALLVAHDNLTDEQIAAKLSIARATLSVWKITPDFAVRVEEHVQAARAAIRTQGIALVENRVARKQADWERLEQIRQARADKAEVDADLRAEGGGTGLVIAKTKILGTGPMATIVTEYAIDTAYLAERDRLEEAVAKELGQRVEKHEVETRDMTAAEALDAKINALADRLQTAAP